MLWPDLYASSSDNHRLVDLTTVLHAYSAADIRVVLMNKECC